MPDSLQPHGMQHSSVLSYLPEFAEIHVHWAIDAICHLISATPFSFCLQLFPASGSFPISQLFLSGSQSIGASALAIVLPMTVEGWFPLGLTRLISLQQKGLSRIFSSTSWKHQVFGTQPSLWSLSAESLSADSWQIERENTHLSPPSWTSLPPSNPGHLVTTEPRSGLSALYSCM